LGYPWGKLGEFPRPAPCFSGYIAIRPSSSTTAHLPARGQDWISGGKISRRMCRENRHIRLGEEGENERKKKSFFNHGNAPSWAM
jgi:hypothetical protein